MAVDNKRALSAYKIGADGGNVTCQYQLGYMYRRGQGIDSPDYEQALVWTEKAAAQDLPRSYKLLGLMTMCGQAQPARWCRARELMQEAMILGDQTAVKSLRILENNFQQVMHANTRATGLPCTDSLPPTNPTPVRPPHEPAG